MSNITSITPDQDFDDEAGFYCLPENNETEVTENKIMLIYTYFKQGGYIKQRGFIARKK